MTTGYVSEVLLGTVLAISYWHSKTHKTLSHYRRQNKKLLISFQSCAAFFSLSIQIAAIVVLARVDYGVSAVGMGIITVQLTWTISVLTLLPLTYAVVMVDSEPESNEPLSDDHVTDLDFPKVYRLLTYIACWALSIYPFMSRMIETYGTSLIGDSPGTAISTDDWYRIQEVCLSGTRAPTVGEESAISAFGITGSLTTSSLALWHIATATIRRHYPATMQKFRGIGQKVNWLYSWSPTALLMLSPLLSCGLIWSYLRLHAFQSQIARSVGAQDADGEWTFGQIVALTLFLPVFIEVGCNYYERRQRHMTLS